jgi:hypothetical protein
MLSNSRRIRLVAVRKSTEHLSPDSRCPGRDLNPGDPEYEAGLLTTRPQRTVDEKSQQNAISSVTVAYSPPPLPTLRGRVLTE